MDVNEQELILQVSKGSEHAFALLFHRHHQHLAAFVFKLTDSYTLTEEVVQDTFLKIWINREQLTDIKNFKGYLFTISKNHTLNCLKQAVKERALMQYLETESVTNDAEESPSFYHLLLDKAINELPPQQQKVYVLSKQQRLKYSEIASLMGISQETVKSYLKLAIVSIKSFVKKNIYLLLLFLTK